jgi:hypothetical protein
MNLSTMRCVLSRVSLNRSSSFSRIAGETLPHSLDRLHTEEAFAAVGAAQIM